MKKRDNNGNYLPAEGKTCAIFDYSGKTIISLNDNEKIKKQEFYRTSTLSNKTKNWIEDPRNPQELYEEIDLTILDKVGSITKKTCTCKHQDSRRAEAQQLTGAGYQPIVTSVLA